MSADGAVKLRIGEANAEDDGLYVCTLSDNAGLQTSSSSQLRVHDRLASSSINSDDIQNNEFVTSLSTPLVDEIATSTTTTTTTSDYQEQKRRRRPRRQLTSIDATEEPARLIYTLVDEKIAIGDQHTLSIAYSPPADACVVWLHAGRVVVTTPGHYHINNDIG